MSDTLTLQFCIFIYSVNFIGYQILEYKLVLLGEFPYGKAVSLRISGEYAANNWRTALFAVIVRNIFSSYREYPANKTGQSKK